MHHCCAPLPVCAWLATGDFNSLTFSINGSIFSYGHFINTFLT